MMFRKATGMCHEVAKLILEHTSTFLERTEAVQAAMDLGMPLKEIEAYLDWLDVVRRGNSAPREKSPPVTSVGSVAVPKS